MQTERTFSWKKAFVICVAVGLLVAGLSVFLQTQNYTAKNQTASGVGSSFEVAGEPARIRIPAINVDTNVQSVGLSDKGDGNMGIPTNFTDVAWYNKGPTPGSPGSAVIAGHLDGKDTPQAVFYNLENLQDGDLVEVIDDKDRLVQFRVIATKIYDYEAPTEEVFSTDPTKTRLNLITCAGAWLKTSKLYNKRIVVFTELVK